MKGRIRLRVYFLMLVPVMLMLLALHHRLTTAKPPPTSQLVQEKEARDTARGTAQTSQTSQRRGDPDFFLPGSLDMTRSEALQRCYVDPEVRPRLLALFHAIFPSSATLYLSVLE